LGCVLRAVRVACDVCVLLDRVGLTVWCCSSRFHGLHSVHAKLLSLRWSEAMEAESAEEEEEESA
jgi:hypothetical protein